VEYEDEIDATTSEPENVPDSAEEEYEIIEDEIKFLNADELIELHEEVIRQFSPHESLYLRDRNLLESAVYAPQASFGGNYLHSSIAAMAAALLCSLAGNHPFENGNKRVAFAAASIFLRINGFRLTLTQAEAVTLTMNVVNHIWGQERATKEIQNGMKPL
jgi:death-on-curing protein